jgi:hypothetical protein
LGPSTFSAGLHTIGECILVKDNPGFTTRPSVVLPDPRLALGYLTNGAAGRDVADAVISGDADSQPKSSLIADCSLRLLVNMVIC